MTLRTDYGIAPQWFSDCPSMAFRAATLVMKSH